VAARASRSCAKASAGAALSTAGAAPFVASWSLREALATGCVVIGSDTPTVSEFVTNEQNGLLVPFFDRKRLADTVLRVLDDAPLARRLRENARRYAEKHLAMGDYIAAYEALIARLIGG